MKTLLAPGVWLVSSGGKQVKRLPRGGSKYTSLDEQIE